MDAFVLREVVEVVLVYIPHYSSTDVCHWELFHQKKKIKTKNLLINTSAALDLCVIRFLSSLSSQYLKGFESPHLIQ